jgi:hypothetical protein
VRSPSACVLAEAARRDNRRYATSSGRMFVTSWTTSHTDTGDVSSPWQRRGRIVRATKRGSSHQAIDLSNSADKALTVSPTAFTAKVLFSHQQGIAEWVVRARLLSRAPMVVPDREQKDEERCACRDAGRAQMLEHDTSSMFRYRLRSRSR